MKALLMLFTFGLVVAITSQAEAAKPKRAKSATSVKAKKASVGKKKKANAPSNVTTSHNFDDHGVTGEYQMPDEALAKVENEKSLADLLGVRTHFKDRLLEASEQE